MTVEHVTRERVRPVAGPLFRQVAALGVERIGGTKRRKLLALLAAYADAGESSPSARVLVATLGLPGGRWLAFRTFDHLLGLLERDGLLRVERSPWGSNERNRYTLTLDAERGAA